ncbi:pyridoxamine 5'-phosphate oxidase family protein [candidate division CSSED10-310 bacterium]|uniref:Pyridoxamine 5'-phosphate oxidase family protein n=1 Tax=candidate division CSSED10-310 bacterium TaxID=2855610 RepID=A0ABV6YY35_UNCC1
MNNIKTVTKNVRSILEHQFLAVLATQSEGQPHTSLVGFVVTDDLHTIIFATPRATRKYQNLISNPYVALLVDTRQHQEADFHSATAVSAYGMAKEVSGADKEKYRKLYLQKHPSLGDFVTSPTCALVVVSVRKYSMVSEFQNVQELTFQ